MTFEDWFDDAIWGNEDFKTCLQRAWEAATETEREACAKNLGCTQHTDPIAVIEMLRSWEAAANARAELLEQYLRSVMEIART